MLHVFEVVTIDGVIYPCKIDTGAFSSSVDQAIAHHHALEYIGKVANFKSANGETKRRKARVTFMLHGLPINTIVSVTDRSDMQFPIIIGRKDLRGFIIEVSEDDADPDNPLNVKPKEKL